MALDDEKAKGHVALKGFFSICHEWNCAQEEMMQLLGGVSRSTLAEYQKLPHVKLPPDTLERISYILGIYKSLRVSTQRPNAPTAGFAWKPVKLLSLGRIRQQRQGGQQRRSSPTCRARRSGYRA